ncbi:hypothetical protein IWQ60_007707 [Tieghemiomyces parasiticus]|uniref:ABC transporter domain-containing protein n=1 Tax=Tieghemiomyces parasiticus TaxID=78921 RepID=A0A9W8DT74_9FUNG|nr:hypothetical protein IWQ60_007707 [Tieghemiomyces parasiticus]
MATLRQGMGLVALIPPLLTNAAIVIHQCRFVRAQTAPAYQNQPVAPKGFEGIPYPTVSDSVKVEIGFRLDIHQRMAILVGLVAHVLLGFGAGFMLYTGDPALSAHQPALVAISSGALGALSLVVFTFRRYSARPASRSFDQAVWLYNLSCRCQSWTRFWAVQLALTALGAVAAVMSLSGALSSGISNHGYIATATGILPLLGPGTGLLLNFHFHVAYRVPIITAWLPIIFDPVPHPVSRFILRLSGLQPFDANFTALDFPWTSPPTGFTVSISDSLRSRVRESNQSDLIKNSLRFFCLLSPIEDPVEDHPLLPSRDLSIYNTGAWFRLIAKAWSPSRRALATLALACVTFAGLSYVEDLEVRLKRSFKVALHNLPPQPYEVFLYLYLPQLMLEYICKPMYDHFTSRATAALTTSVAVLVHDRHCWFSTHSSKAIDHHYYLASCRYALQQLQATIFWRSGDVDAHRALNFFESLLKSVYFYVWAATCVLHLDQGITPVQCLVAIPLFPTISAQTTAIVKAAFNPACGYSSLMQKVANLEQPPDQPDPTDPEPVTWTTGPAIHFNSVTFSYNKQGPPTLDGINLTVPAGKTTAIVGRSGSGKSSLVNLLIRKHDPSEGHILIGDQDIRRIRQYDLRTRIATVSQNSQPVGQTVGEVVGYGRAGQGTLADLAEVEEALRVVGLHDKVAECQEGLEAPMGGGSSQWSGGDKQRLLLARAIIKNAPVVILDEATSAMDSATETAVMEALKGRFDAAQTVLVIAHRLSTVRYADQIVVMDAGRIVGIGTHEELLACGGLYHEMWTKYTTPMGAADTVELST